MTRADLEAASSPLGRKAGSHRDQEGSRVMTTCYCDGPGHAYRPEWCGEGRSKDGNPIDLRIAAAKAELRAAQLSAQARHQKGLR